MGTHERHKSNNIRGKCIFDSWSCSAVCQLLFFFFFCRDWFHGSIRDTTLWQLRHFWCIQPNADIEIWPALSRYVCERRKRKIHSLSVRFHNCGRRRKAKGGKKKLFFYKPCMNCFPLPALSLMRSDIPALPSHSICFLSLIIWTFWARVLGKHGQRGLQLQKRRTARPAIRSLNETKNNR